MVFGIVLSASTYFLIGMCETFSLGGSAKDLMRLRQWAQMLDPD